VVLKSGTGTELRLRERAIFSSKEGNGIPGVVTAEVGAVEYPTESSEASEFPYDPDPDESDMQETEPLPPVR